MDSTQIKSSAYSITINDIMDNVHMIAEKFNPEQVILFGSYAMDNPTRDSDVDLLVIMNPITSSWQTSVEISSV